MWQLGLASWDSCSSSTRWYGTRESSREHMAANRVPKIVRFFDQLPKSGSGKVMWRLLKEQDTAC
jgi:acyl-coenzyme A synthetase/AMP-(fatty) acid ligase